MSEREKKKRQRIYDLLNAQIKLMFLFLQVNSFLRKSGRGGLNKKRKEGFLTALAAENKKNPNSVNKKAY